MILFTLNCNTILNKALNGITISDNNFSEGDAVYIEYVPLNPSDPKPFILQTETLKFYIKKRVPILVFDKYLSIKPDETRWLKKQNVKLFEPALNYRSDFRYFPQYCTKIHTIQTLKLNKIEPRPVKIGFKGIISDKLNTFEKYYVEFGKNYPSFQPKYTDSSNISKEKVDEYTNFNVILDKNIKYSDIMCTILLGSVRDYNIGYLNPDVFTILENNVIILLPEEHKYYHAIFCDTIVRGLIDINFTVSSYEYTYLGYISSIYERINRLYPEFKLEHAVDMIKKEIE